MRTKTTNWYWVSKGNRRRMHGTVPLSEWIPGIAPFYAHRLFCNLLWCKRVEQRDHKQLLLLPPSLSLPPPPPTVLFLQCIFSRAYIQWSAHHFCMPYICLSTLICTEWRWKLYIGHRSDVNKWMCIGKKEEKRRKTAKKPTSLTILTLLNPVDNKHWRALFVYEPKGGDCNNVEIPNFLHSHSSTTNIVYLYHLHKVYHPFPSTWKTITSF